MSRDASREALENENIRWALLMRAIKRLKGIWWMPWRQEAMKDVVRCDKLW